MPEVGPMIEIWTATVHEDGRGKCCKVIGVADTEAGAEKIRADYVSHESSLIWPGWPDPDDIARKLWAAITITPHEVVTEQ